VGGWQRQIFFYKCPLSIIFFSFLPHDTQFQNSVYLLFIFCQFFFSFNVQKHTFHFYKPLQTTTPQKQLISYVNQMVCDGIRAGAGGDAPPAWGPRGNC
jgi:hypothetical protein